MISAVGDDVHDCKKIKYSGKTFMKSGRVVYFAIRDKWFAFGGDEGHVSNN